MSIIKKAIAYVLIFTVILELLPNLSISTYASSVDNVEIPEPIKVVDFSYSFDELAQQDAEFSVVDNAASPTLIEDGQMGQVLKLKKAVISGQEFNENGSLIADSSEYSTIKLSNPYVGLDYLKEYEPYEDVETKLYRQCNQPYWKEGITISYWIKSPEGVNSNVLGFTSERFQIQADDYAKYLCTVKYDLDYNKWTEDEKALLGQNVVRAGVDIYSDFYFELASEDLYLGAPLYTDPENMGRIYWMNKNFVDGYISYNDGSIKNCTEIARYDQFSEAPTLGKSKEDHTPGTSRIRYAWTYSEMWLDATSSFYFNNDNGTGVQLNPNHIISYNTNAGMQQYDCFSINSWNGGYGTYDEAAEKGTAAKSPVSKPDEWHNVAVVIQNDWVRYYLDGEEIDIEEKYSSYGLDGLGKSSLNSKPWTRFNKGTGARYGYGTDKTLTYWCYYGNYVATTIMEWLTMDCTEMTIGGGNRDGDSFNMYANTDEIEIKNIVFYDTMLSDEQIEYLYNDPFLYDKSNVENEGSEENTLGANITYENGTAIVTLSTKAFEIFDLAVISDATCSKFEYDETFKSNVLENSEYTAVEVNNINISDDSNNKYSSVVCVGFDKQQEPIPYEGVVGRFIYENVEEGTEFVVVTEASEYSNNITEAPIIAKLTVETVLEPTIPCAQSAEISYENNTAVITIYTDTFDTLDIGIVSKAICSEIEYDDNFRQDVLNNPNYNTAMVSNKSASDSIDNIYAVISGAGVNGSGGIISYKGAVARFIYEDVEEGTSFIVVTRTAAVNDVTKATQIANLIATLPPTVEPTTTPTVEPTATPAVEPTATPASFTYYVKYNGNGNTNIITMPDSLHVYDDFAPTNSLVKNLYEKKFTVTLVYNDGVTADEVNTVSSTFLYWVNEQTSKAYVDGWKFTENLGEPGTTVELKACWESIVYTPVVCADREGYTFEGWYTNPEYTGNSVDLAKGIEVTSDSTLYAKWSLIPTPTPETSEVPVTETPSPTPTVAVPVVTDTPEPAPSETVVPVPTETMLVYVLGDVDANDSINATDALAVLKHAAKISTLTDVQLLAADTSKDGNINASDALLILKYAAKLISSFD